MRRPTDIQEEDQNQSPLTKRLIGLLLLYAVVSVIVAKLIAELAFAGGPL